MGSMLCSRCCLDTEQKACDFDVFLDSKRVEVEQQAAFFAQELTMYTAKADQVVSTLAASIEKNPGHAAQSWEDVSCWHSVTDFNTSTNVAMLSDSLRGIVGPDQEACRLQACQKLAIWEMEFVATSNGFLICGGGSDAPVQVRSCTKSQSGSPLLPEMILFRVVLPTGSSRIIARGHAPVLRTQKTLASSEQLQEEWKFSLSAQQAILRAGERCIVSYTADTECRTLPAVHFVGFI
jgi:hypothetical protein